MPFVDVCVDGALATAFLALVLVKKFKSISDEASFRAVVFRVDRGKAYQIWRGSLGKHNNTLIQLCSEIGQRAFVALNNLFESWCRAGVGASAACALGIPTLVRETIARDIYPALITNGTRMTADIARQLALAGLHEATVSLDGAQAETHDRQRGKGSFDKAVRGIRYLYCAAP